MREEMIEEKTEDQKEEVREEVKTVTMIEGIITEITTGETIDLQDKRELTSHVNTNKKEEKEFQWSRSMKSTLELKTSDSSQK